MFRASTLLAGVLALVLSACGGDDKADGKDPAEVLALAQRTLDETAGLQLQLSTDDLPAGINGITGADGTATALPAYDGTITVRIGGTNIPVPVIAVRERVFAQLPLTTGWSKVDPADYGAPNPAALIRPGTGFSSLLAAATGVEKGASVRGGANNDEILTEYTATVPGSAMKNVIPSASGDSFDAVFSITDDGELREVAATGVFYPDSDPMTYTVQFTGYGTTKTIEAPEVVAPPTATASVPSSP